MRISDWSSDVCSSDLLGLERRFPRRKIGIVGVHQFGMFDQLQVIERMVIRRRRRRDRARADHILRPPGVAADICRLIRSAAEAEYGRAEWREGEGHSGSHTVGAVQIKKKNEET